MDLVCQQCDTPFARDAFRRFCCKGCHSASMRLKPKLCRHCHLEFTPEKSRQLFCSLGCFNASSGGARDQPEPPPVPGSRWIPLTQGKFALVDEALYPELSRHKWLAVKGPTGHWYAKRTEYWDGKAVGIYMHNQILNTPRGLMGDHRDGDGLNNRGENLRISTGSQNQMNKFAKSATGYKGVWLNPSGNYGAKVMANGRYRYLGRFDTAEAAAMAYDVAAREMHGPSGRYNFPRPWEQAARSVSVNSVP